MHDCSHRVKLPKTVADVKYTRCPPPPLSLAVEVDNTQRSRAHVATGHPAAINLVRPNGQSSLGRRGQMPNGKPEESCLRGGEEEDADGRRVRMSHHHHHHQLPNLNFSSVKTAFIADDGRDGRSGFYVQRACTCFPPIFHSQSQITHSHPSSRLLLGPEKSVHFEEKAGFNGSQWGNSSKLKALSPSLFTLFAI